jgi:hypothetical protein
MEKYAIKISLQNYTCGLFQDFSKPPYSPIYCFLQLYQKRKYFLYESGQKVSTLMLEFF